MIDEPECPACGCLSWKHLKDRTYSAAPSRSEYVNSRLRVLFEVWRLGASEFTAHFVLCRSCGFVCYKPRPTAAEVDAKYRRLAKKFPKKEFFKTAKPLDIQRSTELFEALSPFLDKRRDLLDFGGGGGALLHTFLEHNLTCGVIDYDTGTVPGANWLGSTLEELAPERKFDVVLASHVFEHLPEPVQTAKQLSRILRPDGLIFIEVPLEIMGAPPECSEPVTHINFFCPASLRVLLERSGYDVLSCEHCTALIANGKYRPAVRAIGRVAECPVTHRLPGSGEARLFLGIRRRDQVVKAAAKGQKKVRKLLQKYLKSARKVRARSLSRLRRRVVRYVRG